MERTRRRSHAHTLVFIVISYEFSPSHINQYRIFPARFDRHSHSAFGSVLCIYLQDVSVRSILHLKWQKRPNTAELRSDNRVRYNTPLSTCFSLGREFSSQDSGGYTVRFFRDRSKFYQPRLESPRLLQLSYKCPEYYSNFFCFI